MKVIRKTLVGSSEEFSFNEPGSKFLVKNFSENDCYVNFESITQDNLANSIKISPNMAEVILDNEYKPNSYKKVYVYGTGVVEVQLILSDERPNGNNNTMFGQSYISQL